MNCVTKLHHAIFTSVTVVSLFYFIDLLFLKYTSSQSSRTQHFRYRELALAEAAQAKEDNAAMIRLENTEAVLREILASHREGQLHVDNALDYYQYKLGLEQEYWENKLAVSVMLEKLRRLNVAEVDQADDDLVAIVAQFWIHPPSHQPYDLLDPFKVDYSMGQSDIVDTLLKGKENGFFVECGALDGETRSNSLFLEKERGWEGLLIEAGPGNYRQLLGKHRKAYMTPACLGIQNEPSAELFHKGRNRGRLLDSNEAFDWVSQQHMRLSVSEVQCFPLYTFLLALNRTHIDYLSLDVEGVELDVLQTIPFDKMSISVLTVEFKHEPGGKKALYDFLTDKGYRLVAEVSRDDGLANDLVFVANINELY